VKSTGALWTVTLWCIAPVLAGELAERLDAPLLFVKRHPYFSDHIYDDYYTWHPGGGIYVIENPWSPEEQQDVRAVIDPTTKETLGEGVYRDPDVSWDGKRVLFSFKGSKDGDTSIYEIGVNGRGLRRLTNPATNCVKSCTEQPPPRALGKGSHDISPAYLPDGRIVFTSTRQGSRVPCFNSESDNLHVMNADGSGLRTITVNNVTEFDPSVMPDGRILYGRWEYVDKTALYMQSLWTCNPDGTGETAFFGNNMAKPTAFLDARPVPGSHLVVAALTPHNGQSVGAIAMIDTRLGKNGLHAMTNFTPEYPTEMDQGLRRGPCDPWPLDANTVLIANNATNFKHGVIQIISRDGRREVIHSETNISCYSPMLVKARARPPAIPPAAKPGEPGRFFVQDVYEGLEGVKRGEVTHLRIVEETARISGIPDGGRWWNQAFLVSWQGSYTVKNFLGVVPVYEDGSAYFEAPPGRALYFQALDREGRMVQSMRTFVQAVPGVTRSCVGCHESKATAAGAGRATLSSARRTTHIDSETLVGMPRRRGEDTDALPIALRHSPARPQPERWGSGFLDYPITIQPILDRHCVSCHGGERGIEGGIDLTGGWTWAFSISYETLLKNTLAGFLNCVNEAVKTSEILPPRTHGSGAAPLTKLISKPHANYTPQLTRAERAAVLAWMDGNGNYYGTWNWSDTATTDAILSAGTAVAEVMQRAGCVKCHEAKAGNDWINLQSPDLSRVLRAPLDASAPLGLGWCRERKAAAPWPLVKQPASQPPDVFKPHHSSKRDANGLPLVTFASNTNAFYREMLVAIQRARHEALASPRVDMPGATLHPGECRQLVAVGLPETPLMLRADVEPDGVVRLSWPQSAEWIGVTFEVHRRAVPVFKYDALTRIGATPAFAFSDFDAVGGEQHYAIVPVGGDGQRGAAVQATVTVPPLTAPARITGLTARGAPGEVHLEWDAPATFGARFDILRAKAGGDFEKLTAKSIATPFFTDTDAADGSTYRYAVRAVSRRGTESDLSGTVTATALPESREPIFVAAFQTGVDAAVSGGGVSKGKLVGAAKVEGEALDLRQGGHVTFPHRAEFDLRPRISVECWVKLEEAGDIPVIVSCGAYSSAGWFLQKFGKGWRWHVGGLNCDGGTPALGEWTHLLATCDGQRARLFQNGVEVASERGMANRTLWSGSLYVGQYGAETAPKFQTRGQIAGLKIHRRAVPAADAALAAREVPSGRRNL